MAPDPSERKYVVLLGATSAMVRQLGLCFAAEQRNVIVAGRDMEEIEAIAQDARVRHGVEVHALSLEATDFEGHPAFIERCREIAGDLLEGVVFGLGFMDTQEQGQQAFATARRTVDVNLTSAMSLLEPFARYFEARRAGFIAIISSVAGDRGRQSNYIYGCTKAGLNAYAQGLRNRMHPSNVTVTTIEPGFIDTKMTWGLDGLFLVASPQDAAAAMHRAIRKGRSIAYVPFFWQFIMLIIKSVPEWQFKKMKL